LLVRDGDHHYLRELKMPRSRWGLETVSKLSVGGFAAPDKPIEAVEASRIPMDTAAETNEDGRRPPQEYAYAQF
jgi:hypothetical protein